MVTKKIKEIFVKIGETLSIDNIVQTNWNKVKDVKTSYSNNHSVNIQIGNVTITSSDPVVNIVIEGDVHNVSNVAGDINVSGSSEHVSTTSGDIKIGGNVDGDINSTSGDIHVGDKVTGNAFTKSGDIWVEVLHGEAKTISGDITISKQMRAETVKHDNC